MTEPPVNHEMLNIIDSWAGNSSPEECIHAWCRESESIEFCDEDGDWYEIVVRPIDEPS